MTRMSSLLISSFHESPWLSSLALMTVTSLLYLVSRLIYNIFFHPLSSYHGPWLRAASRLPYSISLFRGDVTHRVARLHEEYGQVVRIAPDTLSYTCSQAWQDVYGLKQSNMRGNLPKDPKFYIQPPGSKVGTISSADDVNHRRLRRLQAPAFSERALATQETYLQHYTDQFIDCIREEAHKANGIVDVVKWLNFLTTDLIGDLSFGETFGGLDTGEVHPWLSNIFITLKAFTFMRELLRLPSFMVRTAFNCIPKSMLEHREKAVGFGAEAARRRLERGSDKPDFMSHILKHSVEDGKGMSQAEIEMASITFIVAGSETTATMISGTVYLLLCNPSILKKLTSIVRSDFPDRSDLNNTNLQQHDYLNAVLKEGLRLYPPAPDVNRNAWSITKQNIGRLAPYIYTYGQLPYSGKSDRK
ncbi:cytochrome P450 [Xylariomycetidae sp. FL0641]|nr:cytochrome P450 [Xylariomycetidae sp. FL0641]